MVDVFTKSKRREIMSRVRARDTAPELKVRSLIHGLGYRFRLHRRDLPGNPDIVLPRLNKIVFVHGCFWHGHARCSRASLPATNVAFWREKIEGNKKRDLRVRRQLRRLGWSVLIIWQCELREPEQVEQKLQLFLES